MTVQTKQQQLKEIEYQTKMLNNLKKWMRNLIILSSIGVVVAYWALNLQSGMPYHRGDRGDSGCCERCVLCGHRPCF